MSDALLWEDLKDRLSLEALNRPHQFDIHGGGLDLIFPHHENEIAQSRCAHGTDVMANVWMHNGYLEVEGRKMSKSEGNFVTIQDLLSDWPGNVLRFAMLQTHYRQPINWTMNKVHVAHRELSSWVQLLTFTDLQKLKSIRAKGEHPVVYKSVVQHLSDDLNTPGAVSALRHLYGLAKNDSRFVKPLIESCEFLGIVNLKTIGTLLPNAIADRTVLLEYTSEIARLKAGFANCQNSIPDEILEPFNSGGITVEFNVSGQPILTRSDDAIADEVDALIAARAAARSAAEVEKDAKNIAAAKVHWAEADRIRDELDAMGIELTDTGDQLTEWRVKR